VGDLQFDGTRARSGGGVSFLLNSPGSPNPAFAPYF